MTTILGPDGQPAIKPPAAQLLAVNLVAQMTAPGASDVVAEAANVAAFLAQNTLAMQTMDFRQRATIDVLNMVAHWQAQARALVEKHKREAADNSAFRDRCVINPETGERE